MTSREATQNRAVRTWAATGAPALLRLAHQLTGDPDTARRVVVAALAQVEQHTHPADVAALDEAAIRAMLRALPRRPAGVTTESPLDALSARARIATVLAFGPGWDAEGIAEVTRTSTGRTRALVGTALALADQQRWERLLADPDWSLPVPAGLITDVDAQARMARRDRSAHLLAGAAIVLALAGVVVAVVRTATAPAPLPRTAHVAGLLAWPPRGDLLRDESLLTKAKQLWRGQPDAPAGQVYVLWAGRVGVGRMVVLQAFDAHHVASVAVVADHDVTFAHARLRVDAVAPITDLRAALLLIPYDGNLNVAGLQTGPGQEVLQMLVRPGVDRVDERSSTEPVVVPFLRPAFRTRALTAGLSEPWLDVRGDQATTAVRAWTGGTVVFTGLVGTGVSAEAVRPVVSAPPAQWSGLPHDLDPSLLADDGLWWSQVCHRPAPSMRLVWAEPRSPTRSRMEFVSCPGGPWSAQFVTDNSAGSEWAFTRVLRSTSAVVGRLPRSELLVVVGDRSVATIVVGGTRFAGRTFVGPWPASEPLHVLDARGRQLPS